MRCHVGSRLSYKSGTLSAWDRHTLWNTREGGRGGEATRLEPRARANFLLCRYCRYCAVNKSYISYLLLPSNEFGPPPVTTGVLLEKVDNFCYLGDTFDADDVIQP